MRTTLPNLDVYVTGKCNYACEYCYGEHDVCGAMSPETYAAALRFGTYLGVRKIQMCGGEPLMCPAFEDFVLKARVSGFDVILRTNGMLLASRLHFVANNCSWVGVSLDGLPADNAAMRRPRTPLSAQEQFETPVANIRALKRLNREVNLILATVASRVNASGLPGFARWIEDEKLPIDRWKVYEFIPDKFRSGENRSRFELNEDEFSRLAAALPKTVNGARVLCQSAHTNRVAANCLIVYQNGDIRLLGKCYGNVCTSPFGQIVDALLEDDALSVVALNKTSTYSDTH